MPNDSAPEVQPTASLRSPRSQQSTGYEQN
jgi:hypothetical protein